jgi:hypothetical protein
VPFPGCEVHERPTYPSARYQRQLTSSRGSFAVLKNMMTFDALPFIVS